MSKRIKFLMAAFAIMATAAFLAAAASASPPPQQWWFHGVNGGGHSVCNNDAKNAVAGPFDSKDACEAYTPPPPPPPPPPPTGDLSLFANGLLSTSVPQGATITFSGTLTSGGDPVSGHDITVQAFLGYGCTGEGSGSADLGSTDGSGNYSQDVSLNPLFTGAASFESTDGDTTSNCVNVAVGAGANAAGLVPPPPSGVFLCNGNPGGNPIAWYGWGLQTSLLSAGDGTGTGAYWNPYAVAGHQDGGDNFFDQSGNEFHLVCSAPGSPTNGMYLTGGFPGFATSDPGVAGLPGWYPEAK